MLRRALIATLLAPTLLAAQDGGNGGSTREPTQGGVVTDSIAGFEPGHLFPSARTWIGIAGTASFGAHAEVAYSEPRRYGPGIVGLGGGVDFYRYSWSYASLDEWSVTVVPVSAYANYHFPLDDRRIDPYVGLGLGFAFVSVSGPASDGEFGVIGGRSTGLFPVGHIGARYFLRPALAVQAQTGLGFGALSLGVTWKR